jgi:hypothetical protein
MSLEMAEPATVSGMQWRWGEHSLTRSGALFGRDELVTEARHCDDPLRVRRVTLDFSA